MSGWLYAHMNRFVSPSPFDLRMASSTCSWRWSAALGTSQGALVGAALITLLKNALQDLLPHLLEHGEQLEVSCSRILYRAAAITRAAA